MALTNVSHCSTSIAASPLSDPPIDAISFPPAQAQPLGRAERLGGIGLFLVLAAFTVWLSNDSTWHDCQAAGPVHRTGPVPSRRSLVRGSAGNLQESPDKIETEPDPTKPTVNPSAQWGSGSRIQGRRVPRLLNSCRKTPACLDVRLMSNDQEGRFPIKGNRPLTCLNWWAILGLNQ